MFDLTLIDNTVNLVVKMPLRELIAYGLIYLAGVLWGIELIPQVAFTLKTKNVEGLSLWFFIICFFAYVSYMVGNGLLGYWNIFISHVPSAILFFTMLILVIRYRRKDETKKS